MSRIKVINEKGEVIVDTPVFLLIYTLVFIGKIKPLTENFKVFVDDIEQRPVICGNPECCR